MKKVMRKDALFNLLTSADDRKNIDKLAARLRVSKSEAVRLAVAHSLVSLKPRRATAYVLTTPKAAMKR